MTTLETLAAWVAALRADDLPPEVLVKARLQAVSAFAAALGAAREPGVRKVHQGLRARGGLGTGTARLFTTGERLELHAAVLGNATATCAFDWDEILLLGHPSHSAVGVAWTLGESRGARLGEVLTAQVAASELAGRFGLACFFGPQNGQHQPFLHHVGGAAAAARLLGLGAEAAADALAIALAQPQTALWPAFLGDVDSKVLTAAHPAELGLCAAEHAAAGVRGPRGILEHPRGFFHRFAFLPAPAALTGLGRAWLSHTLQVKAHAACWYFQAPLSALAALRDRAQRERGCHVRPEEVRGIACEATALATAVHGLAAQAPEAGALRPNTVNFRLDYSLGLLLLHGRLTPLELDEETLAMDGATLRDLARRTTIRHGLGHTRNTVTAVHRALDVPTLLGHPGPVPLLKALARARHEFAGLAGLGGGRELGSALGALGQGLRALHRASRRAPGGSPEVGARRRTEATREGYDLGAPARAAALEALALPCGATVTLTLRDGWEATETRHVPEGVLGEPAGREVVLGKLALGLEAAGHPCPEERAAAGLAALEGAALDTPVGEVLDQLLPPPGRSPG